MTPAERARQIDADEFRRESEQALARALEYSRQKQRARLTTILGFEPMRSIYDNQSSVRSADDDARNTA